MSYLDKDDEEIERIIKTLAQSPSPKVKAFYEMMRAKIDGNIVDGLELQSIRAIYELDALLENWRHGGSFPSYDELQSCVSVLKMYAESKLVNGEKQCPR